MLYQALWDLGWGVVEKSPGQYCLGEPSGTVRVWDPYNHWQLLSDHSFPTCSGPLLAQAKFCLPSPLPASWPRKGKQCPQHQGHVAVSVVPRLSVREYWFHSSLGMLGFEPGVSYLLCQTLHRPCKVDYYVCLTDEEAGALRGQESCQRVQSANRCTRIPARLCDSAIYLVSTPAHPSLPEGTCYLRTFYPYCYLHLD